MTAQNEHVQTALGRVAAAVVATLAIMFVTPIPVYAAFSAAGAAVFPAGRTAPSFLLGVVVIKIGFAFAFVLFYRLATASPAAGWRSYAAIWWVTFALLEVGKAVAPGYTGIEATAGIVSEALYCPLSALAVARILAPSRGADPLPSLRSGHA